MTYVEITVIYDGALAEEEMITEEEVSRQGNSLHASVAEKVARLERENQDGLTEVYILWHDHDVSECECAQYITDHHPDYVF